MKIGRKLIQLRGGLSQTKVAEGLGVSQPAYSKWESDISAPNFYNLVKISNYFKVSLSHLMNEEGYFVQLNNDMQIEEEQVMEFA